MANKLQLINIPQMTMDDNWEIHIETKKKEQNNTIENKSILKELINKWNIIHPKSHQLSNVVNAPEIKLVTTLKEIIEDASQDSINNPCSFIAKLRLLKARNCRIMIEAGIDENTDYIKAKEIYFEKYPNKTLIKA